MQFPPGLEEQTRPNLGKTLKELGLEDGQQVVVTDPAFPLEFNFYFKFKTAS
jgi:ubiquitin-activating enzyme E1 C